MSETVCAGGMREAFQGEVEFMLRRQKHLVKFPNTKYENNFNKLVNKLRSGDLCGIFVGAGVSSSIYPDWEELRKRILNGVGLLQKDGEDYPDCFERCKKYNKSRYYAVLREEFNPDMREEYYCPCHYDILKIRFKGSFITTNIDTCLLKAAEAAGDISGLNFYSDCLLSVRFSERMIYHIHGIVKKEAADLIKKTVLSRKDYKKAYGKSGETRKFLEQIFVDTNMVFVGYSLRDPDIKQALKWSKMAYDKAKQQAGQGNYSTQMRELEHYIFLPSFYNNNVVDMEENLCEDEKLRQYKLLTIRYNPDNKHKDLKLLINNLVVASEIESIGTSSDVPSVVNNDLGRGGVLI